MGFNEFNVNLHVYTENVYVYQATTPHKSSADDALIWDLSRHTQRKSRDPTFTGACVVVITKDLQFHKLKAHVEAVRSF